MDDKATKRGGGTVVGIALVAVLVILPLLYVLSVGPVAWLDSNDLLNEPTHNVLAYVYRPVGLCIEYEVPIIGPAMGAYVEWWD